MIQCEQMRHVACAPGMRIKSEEAHFELGEGHRNDLERTYTCYHACCCVLNSVSGCFACIPCVKSMNVQLPCILDPCKLIHGGSHEHAWMRLVRSGEGTAAATCMQHTQQHGICMCVSHALSPLRSLPFARDHIGLHRHLHTRICTFHQWSSPCLVPSPVALAPSHLHPIVSSVPSPIHPNLPHGS